MGREHRSLIARLRAALVALLVWLIRLFKPGDEAEPPEPSIVPLAAGDAAPPIAIAPAESNLRLRRAFAAAAVGSAAGSADLPDIVWADGDNELLVRPSRTRAVFETGFALVGITVYTEQTGDVEIVVPFAVGRPDQPLGLIAATEPVPRGPAAIVEVWGDPLIAAAWDALLKVAADAAAAAGVDDEHERLLPAALTADRRGLAVTPQARHAFDRRPR